MRRTIIILLTIIPFCLFSQNIIMLDINELDNLNEVTINHSNYNLGNVNDIFDGDEWTLARTNGTNPSIVTIEFDSNLLFMRADLLQTWGSGNWSFELAQTVNELNNQTGSYDSVFMNKSSNQWVWTSENLSPTYAKVIRLSVEKTSGDNNVHISEIFLFVYRHVFPDSAELRAERKTVYLNDTLLYQFRGWEMGMPFFFYDSVTWTSLNTSVATVSQTGWVKGISKGTTQIVAQWGSFIDTMDIKVTNNPDNDDLNVLYIKRLPELKYVPNSSDPSAEGWPANGQQITWRGYVKNWVNDSVKDIEYVWKINGTDVDSGIVHFAAGETKPIDLNSTWSFNRDEIELIIDHDKWHSEEEEDNNSLMVYSDALSVHFYVEQSVYNHFRNNQHKLNRDRNSWEDWAQRNINAANVQFKNAKYSGTPAGVLDRLRIDSVIIIPDYALPLLGGTSPSYQPNVLDSTCDFQYGFPQSLVSSGYYSDLDHADVNNPFYLDDSLMYEFGKIRYLIDLFGFNVIEDSGVVTVDIKENGKYISGTPVLPYLNTNSLYFCLIDGMMNNDQTFVDEYSAMALNLIEGQRPLNANTYPPANAGSFMNDLPQHNRLTIRDQNGFIIPNAYVSIYHSVQGLQGGYSRYFDSIVDVQLTTDINGQVLLDSCPFSADGIIDNISEGVMLIKVEAQGLKRYSFYESTFFNIEYWKGNTDTADYNLIFYMIPYSIEELKAESRLLIYPNPAKDLVNLEFYSFNNECIQFEVYSINGQLVWGNSFFSKKGINKLNLNVSSFEKGIYLISLKGSKLKIDSKIIIK
jgi:hypothetical protein